MYVVCSFIIHRLTHQDCLEIIKKYYQSSSSVVGAQHLFNRELGRHYRYSAQAILHPVETFEREFTIQNNNPASQ